MLMLQIESKNMMCCIFKVSLIYVVAMKLEK